MPVALEDGRGSAAGGAVAGKARCYRLLARDPVGGPCGSGFNFSNGLRVSWQP